MSQTWQAPPLRDWNIPAYEIVFANPDLCNLISDHLPLMTLLFTLPRVCKGIHTSLSIARKSALIKRAFYNRLVFENVQEEAAKMFIKAMEHFGGTLTGGFLLRMLLVPTSKPEECIWAGETDIDVIVPTRKPDQQVLHPDLGEDQKFEGCPIWCHSASRDVWIWCAGCKTHIGIENKTGRDPYVSHLEAYLCKLFPTTSCGSGAHTYRPAYGFQPLGHLEARTRIFDPRLDAPPLKVDFLRITANDQESGAPNDQAPGKFVSTFDFEFLRNSITFQQSGNVLITAQNIDSITYRMSKYNPAETNDARLAKYRKRGFALVTADVSCTLVQKTMEMFKRQEEWYNMVKTASNGNPEAMGALLVPIRRKRFSAMLRASKPSKARRIAPLPTQGGQS